MQRVEKHLPPEGVIARGTRKVRSWFCL